MLITRITLLLASVMLATGCAAQTSKSPEAAPPASSSPSAAVKTSPTATPRAPCPNPEGGVCLGLLKAGTYTTMRFRPDTTYTVPDGWQNFEDTPGNFLLVAPGYDLRGVNEGGSDFIGIYTSISAANRLCSTEAEVQSDEPGVARTSSAIADEFMRRPGLATTPSIPVSVGGLSGVVLDITLADGWTGTCFYAPGGLPVVQMFRGVSPSSLDHPMGPGLTMRLYLLDIPGGLTTSSGTPVAPGTLAIEVDDFAEGAHLDSYSAIVDQIRFGA
jgi:hypothetical protein